MSLDCKRGLATESATPPAHPPERPDSFWRPDQTLARAGTMQVVKRWSKSHSDNSTTVNVAFPSLSTWSAKDAEQVQLEGVVAGTSTQSCHHSATHGCSTTTSMASKPKTFNTPPAYSYFGQTSANSAKYRFFGPLASAGAAEVNATKGGVAEVNATKAVAAKVNATKGSTTEVNATKGGKVKVNATKGGAAEVNATKGGQVKVNATKGGPAKMNATKGVTAKVNATKGAPAKVNATKGGTTEVNATKEGAADVIKDLGESFGVSYVGESAKESAERSYVGESAKESAERSATQDAKEPCASSADEPPCMDTQSELKQKAQLWEQRQHVSYETQCMACDSKQWRQKARHAQLTHLSAFGSQSLSEKMLTVREGTVCTRGKTTSPGVEALMCPQEYLSRRVICQKSDTCTSGGLQESFEVEKRLQGQWGLTKCHPSCATCLPDGNGRSTACTSCRGTPRFDRHGHKKECAYGTPCHHTVLDPKTQTGTCDKTPCVFCKPRECCDRHHKHFIVDPDAMRGVCVHHTDDCTPHCVKSSSKKHVCSKGCNQLVQHASASAGEGTTFQIAVCQATKLVECPNGSPGPIPKVDADIALFPLQNPKLLRQCATQKKVSCEAFCSELSPADVLELHGIGGTCIIEALENPSCFRPGGAELGNRCVNSVQRCGSFSSMAAAIIVGFGDETSKCTLKCTEGASKLPSCETTALSF